MIEGLPTHARFWLQKANWSGRLLSSGDLMGTSSNCLNVHSLRSPLCPPDGVLVVVLIAMYDNIGDERMQHQKYLCGVPPCTCATFTAKFDAWVSLIHAVRAVGVSLPDASLVWSAFLQLVPKMREESSTIEHYMQNLTSNQASIAILIHDEVWVLQMIEAAS